MCQNLFHVLCILLVARTLKLSCLQIKYPIKKEAEIIATPGSGLSKYGFMPAEIAAQAIAPPPTPAFWPEVCLKPDASHMLHLSHANS